MSGGKIELVLSDPVLRPTKHDLRAARAELAALVACREALVAAVAELRSAHESIACCSGIMGWGRQHSLGCGRSALIAKCDTALAGGGA